MIAKVHPDLKATDLVAQIGAVVKQARIELLTLVDRVVAIFLRSLGQKSFSDVTAFRCNSHVSDRRVRKTHSGQGNP